MYLVSPLLKTLVSPYQSPLDLQGLTFDHLSILIWWHSLQSLHSASRMFWTLCCLILFTLAVPSSTDWLPFLLQVWEAFPAGKPSSQLSFLSLTTTSKASANMFLIKLLIFLSFLASSLPLNLSLLVCSQPAALDQCIISFLDFCFSFWNASLIPGASPAIHPSSLIHPL